MQFHENNLYIKIKDTNENMIGYKNSFYVCGFLDDEYGGS